MRSTVRIVLAGAWLGVLLSALRAPAGLELVQAPAPEPFVASGFRAAALYLAAVAVAAFGGSGSAPTRAGLPAGLPIGRLLTGATLGFAAHAFVLHALGRPQSLLQALALGLALALAACWCVFRSEPAASGVGGLSRPSSATSPTSPSSPWLARLGWTASGAGAALALETIGRRLELATPGLALDHAAIGSALLAVLLLGALCFGLPFLGSPGKAGSTAPSAARSRVLAAAGLALGSAGGLVSTLVLSQFDVDGGLNAYARRYGMDLGFVGRAELDLLLAGSTFVVPGLLIGAGLTGLCSGKELAHVLEGAALALFLWPLASVASAPPVELQSVARAGEFPLLGWAAALAATGGVIALLAAPRPERFRPASLAALALCLAAGAAPRLFPARPARLAAPWAGLPPETVAAFPARSGLIQVLRSPLGSLVAHVDRLRVTPLADEEAGEEAALRASFAALAPERRAGARVLFIGQLDPSRAAVLARLGCAGVDRSAPWADAQARIEAALFEGAPPRGERLSPSAARARLAGGAYDLVVALPPQGPSLVALNEVRAPRSPAPAPVAGALAAPSSTTAIVWLDPAAGIAAAAVRERVLLAGTSPEQLRVGVLLGAAEAPATDSPERGLLLACGAADTLAAPEILDARWPVAWRSDLRRAEFAARLARAGAATGGPAGELARGLASYFAAQRPSSPWESPAEQLELEPDALEACASAARASADPDAFTRALWEHWATALAEKRMPDLVLRIVGPIAAAWPANRALELALARAQLEFADPQAAAKHVERGLEAAPHDIDLLVMLADCRRQTGAHALEEQHLRAALDLQPGRRDLLRLLAMCQVRLGRPEGRAAIQELLLENPDDEELARFLQPGPPPPPEAGYAPPDRNGEHAGHGD